MFQPSLASLVDVFEAMSNLNIKLQGTSTNIIAYYDAIRAFMEKIQLWKRRLQTGNFSSFPHLNELLAEKENLDQHYKDKKEIWLICIALLRMAFSRCHFSRHYFPDATLDNPVWKLVRNPFSIDGLVAGLLQEQAIELKCDSIAKNKFDVISLE